MQTLLAIFAYSATFDFDYVKVLTARDEDFFIGYLQLLQYENVILWSQENFSPPKVF